MKQVEKNIKKVQMTTLGALQAGGRVVMNRYFFRKKRFDGDPYEICEQIIQHLWNGTFYMTGLGNFRYLWIRDFGSVAKELVALGHKQKVHTSLHWALRSYQKAGRVALCIADTADVYDMPEHSIDALPWLLHALEVSDYPLSGYDKAFLANELRSYRHMFLKKDGMLQSKKHFAELRDGVLYNQSSYAVTMLASLARSVRKLDLKGFPYTEKQYRDRLMQQYFHRGYFTADLRTTAFSSECNVVPLYLGIITDPKIAASIFDYIDKAKLNEPYPLHYTNRPKAFHYRFWAKTVMRNYAGTTIWTWHGAFYLQALKKFNHPSYEEQLRRFETLLNRYGNFPELLHPGGNWYTTPFYRAEHGMIWCALYLSLFKK